MTTWTVVYRASKFASTFRQTGFAGTWEAASDEATRMVAELPEAAHVYIVPSTDTIVEHTGADGITTAVKIAPTAEQKAAAALRAEKIRTIIATSEARGDLLRKWGARESWAGGLPEGASIFEVAAAAVDRGLDYSRICFIFS